MEKYFVTYAQSLALKELGFDEPCIAFFNGKHHDYKIDDDDGAEIAFINPNMDIGECLNRPLKSQVFEWARKEYRIISVIDFYCDNDEWEDTMYEVRISEFKHFKTHDSFVQSEYKSYEEAESACIDKLIEIVKNK